MEIYLQLVWNSLVFGLLSAILAASFSLIYSVSRVLHLVHGAVVLLGGYFFKSLSLLALAGNRCTVLIHRRLIYDFHKP